MDKLDKYFDIYCRYLIDLKEIVDKKLNLRKYEIEKGLYKNVYYDFKRRGLQTLLDNGKINKTQYDEYDGLYQNTLEIIKKHTVEALVYEESNSEKLGEVFTNTPTDPIDVIIDCKPDTPVTFLDSDVQDGGVCVRSKSDFIEVGGVSMGRIISYKYNIAINGKLPMSGELSRADMENIYNLYTYEGQNLTQRQISRVFPELTIIQFRYLLKAFNIYKSSSPLAPHILEENNEAECLKYFLNVKEHTIHRKIEAAKQREIERKYNEVLLQNTELITQLDNVKKLVTGSFAYDATPFNIVSQSTSNNSMLIYLSDIHTGCMVSNNSLYENEYNEDIMLQRFNSLAKEVIKLASIHNVSDIIINNTGDSLDGMNGETTRGGHRLPQNMDNKEQFNIYIDVMKKFITTIATYTKLPIHYYCVGESNHDGELGYAANVALGMWVEAKFPDSNVEVFTKMIGHYSVGNHTFIITHGKDNVNMKKSFPVTIDARTESFINQYILENKINNKWIHFVKGDSHQTSTTYANNFRYKSVGAFIGGTTWSFANFGKSMACAEIEILRDIDSDESKIHSTLIEFQ